MFKTLVLTFELRNIDSGFFMLRLGMSEISITLGQYATYHLWGSSKSNAIFVIRISIDQYLKPWY